MTKKDDGFIELLTVLPWGVSVALAAIIYVALKFVVPAMEFEHPLIKGMALVAPRMAWMAVFLFIPALISAAESARKRKMLDRQSGIESIRALSWKEFEELVGEAYRRRGYKVKENHSAGPDGGVDLELHKNGGRYLVQCKQWRSCKVGVNIVREMFGIMKAEEANGVTIITSGMFTQEAENFAANKPIDLVDGAQLLTLVQNVNLKSSASIPAHHEIESKRCPRCGGPLIVRKAKRGVNAGSKFWGCSSYPKCRHTEEY